jgi:4-hydroxyphenylpyruvate dioxygenase
MQQFHNGILYVEIYVGMAKLVAWWHQHALGFTLMGKRERKGQFGLEVTYWLQNGGANLLITSALEPAAHDVVSFVDRHGNSIKRFAIEVNSIEVATAFLQQQSAILLSQGIEEERVGAEASKMVRCKLFDDNEICFVERVGCGGILPGFQLTQAEPTAAHPVKQIDHLASVLRINEAEFWNHYLSKLMSLQHVQTIGEEFFAGLLTGMKMFVLTSPNKRINQVIVEPLPEKSKKSQVDIFLSHHYGNGIQHIAFEVDDLVGLVQELKSKGVGFTPVPEQYYRDLESHHPELPIEHLRASNILCEKDEDKILLQVFTEPLGDRPTLFYEFVQRVNDFEGFGAANVKHLFKSLELQLNHD